MNGDPVQPGPGFVPSAVPVAEARPAPGGAENRSERAQMPVSEAHRRQRRDGAGSATGSGAPTSGGDAGAHDWRGDREARFNRIAD